LPQALRRTEFTRAPAVLLAPVCHAQLPAHGTARLRVLWESLPAAQANAPVLLDFVWSARRKAVGGLMEEPKWIPERKGSNKLIPFRLRVPYHRKSKADHDPNYLKVWGSRPEGKKK